MIFVQRYQSLLFTVEFPKVQFRSQDQSPKLVEIEKSSHAPQSHEGVWKNETKKTNPSRIYCLKTAKTEGISQFAEKSLKIDKLIFSFFVWVELKLSMNNAGISNNRRFSPTLIIFSSKNRSTAVACHSAVALYFFIVSFSSVEGHKKVLFLRRWNTWREN